MFKKKSYEKKYVLYKFRIYNTIKYYETKYIMQITLLKFTLK